ncbi:MAG: ATP-binding protein, partial [Betaproteobacteria bacterium]
MAMRMGNIVGEIKTFSRRPPVERVKVRVADVIAQAQMMVAPRIRQVGAQIDVQASSGELSVWADQQRLEQVLVNLLINALDAVGEVSDKRILVRVSDEVSQVSVCIRDSGEGIPEEVLAHLFEPFFTTKSAGKGLGLGLPISRMIISELGGRIEAQNQETGGAQFTVYLEKA